ncbi:predicted protein, partial [Nematostella vectensis]
TPVGIEDHRIPSGAFSASSSYNFNHGPDRARLNQPNGHGRTGAWSARDKNRNQWLQVDLGAVSRLTGVATQGRHDAHQWVTSYTLAFSKDGKRFYPYRQAINRLNDPLFRANTDRNTVVYHRFAKAIRAQYVRVHPKKWRSHISMRVELFGCQRGELHLSLNTWK